MSELVLQEYKEFISQIKHKIKSAQLRAHIKVNEELLRLYWDIGSMIVEKQKNSSWGDKILENISKDLQKEFPNLQGFSLRNIKYMRGWYQFYAIGQQPVAQIFLIPWGHNIHIITKAKNIDEALFYMQKTIENGYSRAQLVEQMKKELYQRSGKAITNFDARLPKPQSDLANEITKDPYNFYISAIDEELKSQQDNPTIGILICKSKSDTIVEYAIRNINTPIGISQYELTEILPKEYEFSLPTIEQIEAELDGIQ